MGKNQKYRVQITWGFILVLTGVSVFLRVPYVMPKIQEIDQFSRSKSCLEFCFYFVGIFLICGGVKKISENFKKLKPK